MDYFITAEKEVLREVAASINATIIKYKIRNNIPDDSKNEMDILSRMVYELSDSLINNSEYTMDDLHKIQAKLEFAKDFVNEVIKCNE